MVLQSKLLFSPFINQSTAILSEHSIGVRTLLVVVGSSNGSVDFAMAAINFLTCFSAS